FGWVTVWTTPEATDRARRIRWRTRVPILESAAGADGAIAAYRIGEGEWLRAGDVRVAAVAAPPPGILPGERWIDIDLTSQVLVAYEGERPVYATLVSSGAKKTPTPTGVYRVWLKFAETDMSGGMGESDAYSVATVPWTQFYARDLALHTSYWHDKFGTPRSHGCINLAPIDARFLYFWSGPDVPPGWSMAHGLVERPGSLVRVRSAEDPEPEVTGYAVRVLEARRAAARAAR
ncbi:MAG TPA: L,D-transpeptidase, partial [Kofleriaceae bacterium]|nr:L,D-transpeptidase [Kofleriaceae bacterium]